MQDLNQSCTGLAVAVLCARFLITSTLQSCRLLQLQGVIINPERDAYIESAFHLILTPRSPSIHFSSKAFETLGHCWL